MSRTRLLLLALVVLALSGLTGAAAFAAPPEPAATVTISTDKAAFTADESVLVNVTITNNAGHPVKVLKWFTPAEGVEEPLFVVSVDGAPVQYVGPVYKRPEPKNDDYVNLKPGESLTRSVDLRAYYDLSVTGNYAVRYAVAGADLLDKDNGQGRKAAGLVSNEITVFAEASRPSAKPTQPPPTPGFNKCSATQIDTLNNAKEQAKRYSDDSVAYLNGSAGPRYTTWFGGYIASRFNSVAGHFDAIQDAFYTKNVTFDCGCKQKYYAYVYPNQPYNIYVCSVFWQAPLTGTDSQAGTLIHEMSHFTVVAGTDDYVYGQTGAKNLALTNPEDAVMNADNHEYFAENTPYQN
jgi:peptidyl-Lys metalloendopeptidase